LIGSQVLSNFQVRNLKYICKGVDELLEGYKDKTTMVGLRYTSTVYKDKSAVYRPWRRKLSGFTFYQWYGKIGMRRLRQT